MTKTEQTIERAVKAFLKAMQACAASNFKLARAGHILLTAVGNELAFQSKLESHGIHHKTIRTEYLPLARLYGMEQDPLIWATVGKDNLSRIYSLTEEQRKPILTAVEASGKQTKIMRGAEFDALLAKHVPLKDVPEDPVEPETTTVKEHERVIHYDRAAAVEEALDLLRTHIQTRPRCRACFATPLVKKLLAEKKSKKKEA